MRKPHFCMAILWFGCFTGAIQAQDGAADAAASGLATGEGVVVRDGSASQLLQSIGSKLRQGVSMSDKARRKRIAGHFKLDDARGLLDRLAAEAGLIWYSDGKTLHVYDASELQHHVGRLAHTSIDTIEAFLDQAGLFDPRYPLRGASDGVFHVAAPPIYVHLISEMASQLDRVHPEASLTSDHLEVIALRHSFAATRTFTQRGASTQVPGMAQVVQSLMHATGDAVEAPVEDNALTVVPAKAAGPLIVSHEPGNNLIVRGTTGQIQRVRELVRQLDQPRRQVELSLWIVDLRRSDLDALGIEWSGQSRFGNRLGVQLNPGALTSTLDGQQFLASIAALAKKGHASIVSQPVVLTQENTPALFDSSTTFYTRLVGERNAQLDSVTFGTMVSVVSRVSDQRDVELNVAVEDGAIDNSRPQGVDSLPMVARTQIDTVARVPRDLSLLIGGYARTSSEASRSAMPGLSRVPLLGWLFRSRRSDRHASVRVFLIQPRVLADGDGESAATLESTYGPGVGRSLREAATRLDASGERGASP